MKSTTYFSSNSEYLEENPTWHSEDSPWKSSNIKKMIIRNNLHPKTIVEIGCGAGEILNQLHETIEDKSINFYGYEISPDAFAMTKIREKERLHFYHEDLLAKDAFYDLLLMIDVFEHVEGYYDFVRKSASKATYKIYHIPLAMNASAVIRNQPIEARKVVGHLHHFMKDTALSLIQDTGQEIIDWFYTGSTMAQKNKKFRTRVMNIPRQILFKFNKDFTVRLIGGYSLLVLAK